MSQFDPSNYLEKSRALQAEGDYLKALEFAMAALQADEDDPIFKEHLAGVLGAMNFKAFNPDIKNLIGFCLQDRMIDHQSLLPAWYKILTFHPEFQALYEMAKTEYKNFSLMFKKNPAWIFLQDPYVFLGLRSFVIADINFERLFTYLRRFFCECPEAAENYPEFMASLALYCFATEYVFAISAEEEQKIPHVKSHIVKACYEPHNAKFVDPDQFEELVLVTVNEPAEEQEIKKTIPLLASIENEVSQHVRAQYEEFPYPRWKNLASGISADSYRKFLPESDAEIIFRQDANFLVAGCGTGEQTLQAALAFPNAEITAIDLSHSSLAFAIRKARERNIQNVKFYQADILRIGHLGKQYDFIVSTGVLHHMQDPLAGWASLVKALKPGGLMRIALYSELARGFIVRGRDIIAREGYGSDAASIRKFRADCSRLLSEEDLRRVQNSSDFYYMSECRDMLFHVQEHRFTMPQIEEAIKKLGLEFVKFEMDPQQRAEYHADYPDDAAGTNLANWHEFETHNPDLFKNMYRFWVRKPD